MQATGIVRKVDELGRVVIPIEIRRTFEITEKDGLEIFIDGDSIILKKYKKNCIFGCSQGVENLKHYKGQLLCEDCIKKIKGLK